jgi:hypothetical protein
MLLTMIGSVICCNWEVLQAATNSSTAAAHDVTWPMVLASLITAARVLLQTATEIPAAQLPRHLATKLYNDAHLKKAPVSKRDVPPTCPKTAEAQRPV